MILNKVREILLPEKEYEVNDSDRKPNQTKAKQKPPM